VSTAEVILRGSLLAWLVILLVMLLLALVRVSPDTEAA